MKRLIAILTLASAPLLAQESPILDAFNTTWAQLAGADDSLKLRRSPTATIVEFYNEPLKHYFRTGELAEVTAVTNGAAGAGWIRTMDDFPAWSAAVAVVPGSFAVYRFYAPGANSHFYTINAAEADQVKLDPGWKYEGISFFATKPTVAGCAAADYTAVYRAYNNRAAHNDSNHRFTTLTTEYQKLITAGWAGEGIAMCVPKATTIDQQKTEQLLGGTWTIGPYRYGSTTYTDQLTFTDLFQSSSGTIYATGTNKYGGGRYPTLGGYSTSLGSWLILSSLRSTGTYPHDAYQVTVTGDTMTGCYWFLFSASSPITQGTCTPITGSRK